MKYKILYVNLFPQIGGAETSLIYLIQGLDKKLFEPFTIVPDKGMFSRRLENICHVIYLSLPGYSIQTLFLPGINPFAAYKFVQLCKLLQPDLIHLTHITQAFYAGIVRHLFDIPVVATSWMNSDAVYFYQNLVSNFGCNLIFPVTEDLKIRILSKGFIPETKITPVTPGIDCSFFQPSQSKKAAKQKFGINTYHLTISIVSRFDPVKDYLTFIKAMDLVNRKFPDLQILIAQDTQINLEKNNQSAPLVKKMLDEYLNTHPLLKPKVKFTGYFEDLRHVYHATDILVNSSLYESLGMSLIEASACEIPIVATDPGKNVVVNGHTGFLVPVQRPDLMAEKILLLAQNPKMRRFFGLAGRKHIAKNFNIVRSVKHLTKIYLSLIRP